MLVKSITCKIEFDYFYAVKLDTILMANQGHQQKKVIRRAIITSMKITNSFKLIVNYGFLISRGHNYGITNMPSFKPSMWDHRHVK